MGTGHALKVDVDITGVTLPRAGLGEAARRSQPSAYETRPRPPFFYELMDDAFAGRPF
jgi:hypothetical protein